jgi:uncharacterized repeat protein (TIGR01451 family)
VSLSDLLPTGSSFVSMTPAAGNPDSFSFSQGSGSVTESAPSVASGNTDTFTLIVSAPTSLPNGATFNDTASASSSNTDPNSANNSATVTGSIVNTGPSANLVVSNTGPGTATEGGNVTYTITVTNNGTSAAPGAVLTDTLSANPRFVSATTTQGAYSESNGVVTFNIGTLSYPGSVTLTITVQAMEDGNLTNSATVTSNVADPNSANNSVTASTTVSEASIVVSAPVTTNGRNQSNVTVATFTHANGIELASAFTATINWGDGKTSVGTITQTGATYSVLGSHRYSRPGIFTITTTVTEVGNATQLLLAKVGDEVPGLPDHWGRYPDPGTLWWVSQNNQHGRPW